MLLVVTISCIFPIAEFFPMFIMTIEPVPPIIFVPDKITGEGIEECPILSIPQFSISIFFERHFSVGSLDMAFVSPVMEDSSIRIEKPLSRIPSPGTSIPYLSKTTSPTWISPTRTFSTSTPFLMQMTVIPEIILSLSF